MQLLFVCGSIAVFSLGRELLDNVQLLNVTGDCCLCAVYTCFRESFDKLVLCLYIISEDKLNNCILSCVFHFLSPNFS